MTDDDKVEGCCGIIPCADCDHYMDCTSPDKVYDEDDDDE